MPQAQRENCKMELPLGYTDPFSPSNSEYPDSEILSFHSGSGALAGVSPNGSPNRSYWTPDIVSAPRAIKPLERRQPNFVPMVPPITPSAPSPSAFNVGARRHSAPVITPAPENIVIRSDLAQGILCQLREIESRQLENSKIRAIAYTFCCIITIIVFYLLVALWQIRN